MPEIPAGVISASVPATYRTLELPQDLSYRTLQTCTGLQLGYLASPSPNSLHNHTILDTFRSYYPAGSPTITRTVDSSREATPPLPAKPEKPKISLDYEQQQRAGKVRKTGNTRTYRALFAANIPDHAEHEEPEEPPTDPPAKIPTAPTQSEKTFLEVLREQWRSSIAVDVDPPPPEEKHKVNQTYQRGPRKVFLPGKDLFDSSEDPEAYNAELA